MSTTSQPPADDSFKNNSSWLQVFAAFLKLGLSSFGGPVAHIGYFRQEFVARRKWLSDDQFAQLLGLCQFLPGPASSQLGFSIGLLKAGWPGAIAAFTAFTLPSALLLLIFAKLAPLLTGTSGSVLTHGLKLVALAVVAHGVISMTRSLCPDKQRLLIALSSTSLVLCFGGAWLQLTVIVMGALAGLCFLDGVKALSGVSLTLCYQRTTGWVLLVVYLLLLFCLPLLAYGTNSLLAVAEAFYRAGALVFGGGHVVLPLLEEAVVAPGWLSQDVFMAGYGAAQAVPGPMFTLSAYLGAHLPGDLGGIVGASVALLAIFLPGFLLVSSALSLLTGLAEHPSAARMIAGVNAAVVGLLAAALYRPIFTSSVHGPEDLLIALAGLAMLIKWQVSTLLVVCWCLVASAFLAVVF